MDEPDRTARILATTNEKHRFELLSDFVTSVPASAVSEGERLLGAADPPARTLGADLLGQVAYLVPPDVPRIVDILLARLGVEADRDALSSVILALGRVQDHRAAEPIIAFADHATVEVRFAVAVALPLDGTFDEPTLATLRRLSADVDDDVRDWATTGLAESDATDPATIEALAARTDDPHYDTRCEAIHGLARRGDPRARALVDRELGQPMVGALIERARDLLAKHVSLPEKL